ncbi:MAG: DUF1559 domain-containing protein [Thermoguttaceae bacterium]
MRCSRFLAALTAAMLLVVYSGCGEDKKDSSATRAGGTTQAKADEKGAGQTAVASSLGSQASSANTGTFVNTGPIDLSLVTPGHFAAIVIHPRRIAQSPLVAEQLKDEMIAASIKKFGIDPSEVEQLVVLFNMDEKQPERTEPMAVMIARFTHDVDAKEVLTKLQAAGAPNRPVSITEIKVGGKTCLDLGAGGSMAYVPSRNTIVLTLKENMGKVVSGAEPKGPLFERLKNAEADNDLIVALETGAVPDFDKVIDAAKRGDAPPLDLEAVKKLRGGTATFSLTASPMLRMVLDTKDATSTGNVEELLQQVLRMAGGALAMGKQSMPKEVQATFGPLADQVFDGAKITKSGSQVVLDVKRPEILDTAGASIASAIRQSVLKARTDARRLQQMSNLKQISLAMLTYEDTYRSFPPVAIEKDGRPLLSWRVAILPFLGEVPLSKRFHLDEPWDSPYNLEVAKVMPSVFQSPDSPSDGKTRVMLFTGKGAAFNGGKKFGPPDIRDGMSKTILCVEAGPDKAVPWTKPEDLPFDPANPLAALGNASPQGFIAAFFDGHVMQLKVDNETLKALITPDGGEVIDPAKLQAGR